jgi:hypothetical protein
MKIVNKGLTRIEFKDLMEALYREIVYGEPYWFNEIYLMDEEFEMHHVKSVDLLDSRFRCYDDYWAEYDWEREYHCNLYVR